jgi:WhiB family transcriptional regulator, redox-sensing transcriptional regulator
MFHVTREPWMRQRACTPTQLHLFFPARGASANPAKQICANCPVVQQCAAWALNDHGLEGVLGGMTAGERDRIRSRTNAA